MRNRGALADARVRGIYMAQWKRALPPRQPVDTMEQLSAISEPRCAFAICQAEQWVYSVVDKPEWFADA
jgi:hypothetical protein